MQSGFGSTLSAGKSEGSIKGGSSAYGLLSGQRVVPFHLIGHTHRLLGWGEDSLTLSRLGRESEMPLTQEVQT